MKTLIVYWLALKYWVGGASWAEAFDTAMKIVFWNNYGRGD
jgi:hypothetical protein